jgi:glycosyltransferase involved in cell wall biosynthesis
MEFVSCVMPTRGRREYARQAVGSFLSQTYEAKELVILDDWDDPSFPEGIEHPLIRYHVIGELIGKLNIPQKRNRVNALTQGSIIAHFDSDDWSAPDRLADQVPRLLESGKGLSGYCSMWFVNEIGDVYRYKNFPNAYALGSSFCYLKSFWEQHPYIEGKFIGSDTKLCRVARSEDQLISVDDDRHMVARIHSGNTNETQLHVNRSLGRDYLRANREDLPEGFAA